MWRWRARYMHRCGAKIAIQHISRRQEDHLLRDGKQNFRKEEPMKSLSIAVIVLLTVWVLNLGGVQKVEAQSYPDRPISLIGTGDPGAISDTQCRLFGEELGKVLKTPVVVTSKPGAGSIVGADFVVKSRKNGYTLLYTPASGVVYTKASNPEIVPFDPAKDLEPLGFHCYFPVTAFVLETSPYKTFNQLIEYARKNPGAVRVSVPGQGNVDHFNVEIVMSMTGAQFTVVPFKGGAACLTALLGGHVDVNFAAVPTAAPYVRAGKQRLLVVSNKVPEFQDVPTVSELGYKQDLLYPWFALYGPAGIPDEVKKVLIPAIETVVKNPEHQAKLRELGVTVEYRTPAELRKLQENDYARARSLAIKLGLSK
jgi:tripartite-type tricarboxylate transporter receptor subunit TctC